MQIVGVVPNDDARIYGRGGSDPLTYRFVGRFCYLTELASLTRLTQVRQGLAANVFNVSCFAVDGYIDTIPCDVYLNTEWTDESALGAHMADPYFFLPM